MLEDTSSTVIVPPVSASIPAVQLGTLPRLSLLPFVAVRYAPSGLVTYVLSAIAYCPTELAIVRAIAKDKFALHARFIRTLSLHTINYH